MMVSKIMPYGITFDTIGGGSGITFDTIGITFDTIAAQIVYSPSKIQENQYHVLYQVRLISRAAAPRSGPPCRPKPRPQKVILTRKLSFTQKAPGTFPD